jgi:DNA processing protein
MTIEHIFLHAWNIITNTNHRILDLLFREFGSFEVAWKEITRDQLASLSKQISLTERKNACNPKREWEVFEKTCEKMKPSRLTFPRFILREDPDYPPLLKQLSNAPFGLYITGEIQREQFAAHRYIGIVGTRRPSEYGRQQTKRVVHFLSQVSQNITIVSGLADGIDMEAHESAIRGHLPTWAILGNGHNHISPYKDKLTRQILDHGGLIMSEYPPETQAEKFRFPERNRIIAGLSQATLVTQAPIKSGANITAKIAFQENRDVFALTADIDRTDCAGNLALIEQQIATPLTSYGQLINVLGITSNFLSSKQKQPLNSSLGQSAQIPSFPNDPHLQAIIGTLTHGHTTPVSQLMESTRIPSVSLLLQHLTELELDGYIEQTSGGYRLKSADE